MTISIKLLKLPYYSLNPFPANINRSSHRRCSIKKVLLKIFAIFTKKHLCWSLFLIKLQAWRPATLFKTPTQVVFCEYCEILRTPILKNICEWLLLPKNIRKVTNEILNRELHFLCRDQNDFKNFQEISQRVFTCKKQSSKSVQWRPATLLKRRLWHRYFPVNFGKLLRTPFSIEHCWWLLLTCSKMTLEKPEQCAKHV